ncbi:NAD-dependent epimerase/dehydratase family protein [Fluviispira sanaruensis]|uniref:Epimerase n=1 Tax=Fluviispira sanaruensis TaxID=2493639 RepID=A0A4P2VLV5_FLUSA|nr:NAD-dependent epimerase/dehydratase family protein [Fluviispira sanaruensis]BBH53881.1 epimerase [Fluviispira sanaruensis]
MLDLMKLRGPILILGASGFIGANLFKRLNALRNDVYGTSSKENPWRLSDVQNKENILIFNLRINENLFELFEKTQPQTIFNCIAYGAYHFENNPELIYETNFLITLRILNYLEKNKFSAYIHSGSSSEYGDNSAGPSENDFPLPNSHYAVSKVACSNLILFYGKKKKLPIANLRLYSVYGPLEDPSRLIPNIVHKALENSYPPFVNKDISRDFIYIDDVCNAFISAALNLEEDSYGESFNIGFGQEVTIEKIAHEAKIAFSIPTDPIFGNTESRHWDNVNWFANIEKTKLKLNWQPKTSLQQGLLKTADWLKTVENWENLEKKSKKYLLNKTYSTSVIIACYKDNLAIPLMYARLTETLSQLNIEYEIIFVNDGSPDNTEEVIRNISAKDPNVMGITHSRNFGSQAAFQSGMKIARMNSCILMDGDLQDPPEIIPQFIEKWREGFDVVFGIRVKREAPFFMQIAYKLFYRIFSYFSYVYIPKDAGDFSLIDKKVVSWILKFSERDVFLRGIRAFVGFKQTGICYLRPERAFGKSTNNLLKNLNWAKKGILSFSYVPLSFLTFCSIIIFSASLLVSLVHIFLKLIFPEIAPQGITTVMILVIFFGSSILISVAFIGEYIAKIFEEVKARPKYIRKSIIQNGSVKNISE